MMMSRVLITLMFLAFFSHAKGQEFPDQWLGKWAGDLHIFKGDSRDSMTYPMQLEIIKTSEKDQWRYITTYGEGDNKDVRDYLLIHKEGSHYQVDEQNSIVLDEYFINNRLITVFEVQGTLLTISSTFKTDQIIFEVYPVQMNKPVVSGGEGEIPTVNSYPIRTYQKAILKRLKEN